MNRWSFLLSTLRYRWGVQVLTMAVMAMGTAVLVGSFLVGHSMTTSLENVMERRLGNVKSSLSMGDRFVGKELVERLKKDGLPAVGVIQSKGRIVLRSDDQSLGGIQVWGVDDDFWALSGMARSGRKVLVNDSLAQRLKIESGSQVLLKLHEGGAGVSETVVGTMNQAPRSLDLIIGGIADPDELGDFHLLANQLPPYNLFVPLSLLAEALDQEERVNRILLPQTEADDLHIRLKQHLDLNDLELEIKALPDGSLEARSSRVFLEDLWGKGSSATLFTYLATSFNHKDKKTPYPIVAGVEADGAFGELTREGVLLTDWLAEDLGARVGDELSLDYAWLDPLHRLKNREYRFKVEGILPVDSALIDPDMMPDFPGLKDSEHCRDWEVGFKMDLDLIREKDETYWETYKGRPKAFIHFEKAQELWGNRFGNRTALRFSGKTEDEVKALLLERLDPAKLGMVWQDHRSSGERANAGAMDFSGLFIGFSLFISIASIALMHMLFRFRLEGDVETISLQMALGFSARQLRRTYTLGFLVLSLPGLSLGILLGHGFGAFLLYRLSSQWQDAVGSWNLDFYSGLQPSVFGALSGWAIAWMSIWPSLRKVARPKSQEFELSKRKRSWVGGLSGIGSIALIIKMVTLPGSTIDFFILGTLLMISWVSLLRFLVRDRPFKFGRLSFLFSQMARRSGRSLSVILMMAIGSFMVLSLEAFRIFPDDDTTIASSGSGGFQIMLKLERGVERDLGDINIQEELGLGQEVLQGARLYPLRFSAGEDASCLNLNRAQRPNLIGIDPDEFKNSERFTFMSLEEGGESWDVLATKGAAIPIVGDQNTLMYSLGLSLGSTFTIVGENGEDILFKVVGTLAPSIFQDALLLDRQRLLDVFPSVKGFERVMVEAPLDKLESLKDEMNRGLEPYGADAILTQDQLMAFHQVQNRYLSIFQSLGWLGLGLGCAGLFLVVLQNVQDRKEEIGLWTALGKSLATIRQDFMVEHSLLFLSGLGGGLVCGLIAITPLLLAQGESMNFLSILTQFLILVLIGGLSLMLGLSWLKPTPLMEVDR